jgi:hypothetical protein
MGDVRPPDTGNLQVSVEDLDAAAEYIERLKQYVEDTLKFEMERIRKRMVPETPPAVRDGTPFGGFDDALRQWRALETSTANMEQHLATLSTRLDALKKGTEDIAKAFRDTEERNAATGKQIERMLEAATPPPAPTTGPQVPAGYTA